MGCDHAPITLKIAPHFGEEHKIRYNFSKANWELFKIILSSIAFSSSNKDLSILDVNTLNNKITKDILIAADSAIPKFKDQYRKSFPKNIIDLIEMRRIIRKRLKDSSCDQSKTKFDYNKLTALIRTKIKEHTEKKWTRFLGKLGPYPTSSRSFWEIINKAKEQKKQISFLILNLKV